MDGCSKQLEFGYVDDPKTGKSHLKLKSTLFCRCRHCTICQWRRLLKWRARFFDAAPAILRDYPSAEFVHLTLTVKNCEVQDLRSTLDWMNKAWQRMTQRKQFPAIGFARSTEVTKNWDVYYKGSYQGRMGGKTLKKWKKDKGFIKPDELVLETTTEAHPHFHALLMVSSTYGNGNYYLSFEKWQELWKSGLRVDYKPNVDIRKVRPNKRWLAENDVELTAEQNLAGAIVETFTYTVKPSDLVGRETEADQQWLLHVTQQLENTRAIALGGVFKKYLSEDDPEDLVGKSKEPEDISASSVWYKWQKIAQRYMKIWED